MAGRLVRLDRHREFSVGIRAAAYLADDGFAEVFTAHENRVTMGGQFFPNGQEIAEQGGYRLSRSWSFGSGTGHSEYVAAGLLMDGGEVRSISEGFPDMQVAVVPRAEISFNDGWFVQGLKGTGSYDYSAEDVFVPTHRTFPLFYSRATAGHVSGHAHRADAGHGNHHVVGARSRQEHA